MTVKITKPSINVREKLSELDKETGIKGEELLRADTSAEAREALQLDQQLFTDFESTGIDDNATSTAVTIDSSGNVLVGKTVQGIATSGVELTPNDRAAFTKSGGAPILVNRTSNDGEIINLRKDGTTVGSIGSEAAGRLILNSENTTGYLAIDGNAQFRWRTNDFVPHTDNSKNLGEPTGRFKDLYLSGGVYLGGTGAANKLDDYEEGTFTATYYGDTSAGTTTYTAQAGFYTKIGNRVSFQLQIGVSSATGTGAIRIGGLPFTLSNATSSTPIFSVASSGFTFSGQLAAGGIRATATLTLVDVASDAGETQIEVDSSVSYLRVSGVYFVD
jgi:hypothetical protein